jgi:uncharacterized membrane protein
MFRKTVFATALAVAVSTSPAFAASILADGGFEVQGTASTSNYCYFGFSAAGNPACQAGAWSGVVPQFGGSGLQFEGNNAWPGLATPDGTRYGFIQLTGSLNQKFTPIQSGNYLLSWLDAGRPPGCCGGNQRYYAVIDDGVNLAPLLYQGSTTTGQGWTGRQADFTVGLNAGTTYTLTFQGLERVTDQTSFIDAVSLDFVAPTVPEPASWALLLAGFGLVGAAARRRGHVPIVTA